MFPVLMFSFFLLNQVWDAAFLIWVPSSADPVIKIDVFDSDAGILVNGSDVSNFIERSPV